MKNTQIILVTGGAGFIGSNLCGFLIESGYQVICLDNLLTGREENLIDLKKKAAFTFVHGDIRDYATCVELTKNITAISHQAALGSVPRSIENPIPTNEINCQGFLNMIQAARVNGVKRFVYASSSSVYGNSVASPKKEEDLGKPLSPYAVSKLTNELYGRIFSDLYGIETIGLRYFNVFGKNQDPNGAYAAAIPKFIQIMRDQKSPVIYGDGNQTRDFTYIRNVLSANKLALETTNKNCFGESYNVACGKSYSLNYVVEIIRTELVRFGLPVENLRCDYSEQRKNDILNSLADITKIKRDLGFKIETDFDEGMREYISQILA
ncbi:MAG: SDR family oxidoreductase [Crocinitomicaceae bacterium]|nr:SDR family oxidoreductase [Crocinitomicaceae bacterium]